MKLKNNRNFSLLAVIFCAAFLVRLAYALFLRHHYFFYDYPGSDVTFYQQWAESIARGNFLGKGILPALPLYPYFLAFVKIVTFGSEPALRVALLLLGSLNCVLIVVLAQKLFSSRVAVLAGILNCFNFMLIYYDWLMMPVTFLVTVSIGVLLLFYSLGPDSRAAQWGTFGFLTGLAAMGDGKFIIVFTLLMIVFIFQNRAVPWRRLARVVGAAAAGFIFILFLAGARNKAVVGGWIFLSPQGGLNFYVGNNTNATGLPSSPMGATPTHEGNDEYQRIFAETATRKKLSAREVSDFWVRQSLAFITQNPGEYANLLGNKLRLFFTDTEEAFDMDILFQKDWRDRLDVNPFFIVCPLAIVGWGLTFRRKELAGINGFLAAQLIFTLVFYMNHRHRMTVLPFLLMLEAYGIYWMIDQVKSRSAQNLSLAGGFVLIFLMLCPPQKFDAKKLKACKESRIGNVYAEKKEHQKARKHYAMSLAIKPTDFFTLYLMGNTYISEANYLQAAKYYQKALAIFPYNTDALYNLGYAREMMGDLPSAAGLYQSVVALQPQKPDAYFCLVRTFFKMGDCPRVRQYSAALLNFRPDYQKHLAVFMDNCL